MKLNYEFELKTLGIIFFTLQLLIKYINMTYVRTCRAVQDKDEVRKTCTRTIKRGNEIKHRRGEGVAAYCTERLLP